MTNKVIKPRIFILTSRVYEVAGGRTKATIARMMFLQQHFDTTLIEMSATKYPGEELSKVFAKYQTDFNAVNPWLNSEKNPLREKNYLDFLKEQTGSIGDPKIFEGAQETFTLQTLSGSKIKSFMQNGKIARLRIYHPDGKVDFCALDDKQNIFLRELYSKDDLLARYYLNSAGQVSSGFVIEKDNAKKFIYRANNNKLIYTRSINDHNIAFLNDILQDGDIIISDVRYYDDLLEKLQPHVNKVHVWHEIALNLRKDSGVNPAYTKITDPNYPLAETDRVVVFTDDARDEYAMAFPHMRRNFTVIPYGMDVKLTDGEIARDKNLFVSIGRITPDKNLAAQIQAFAIFRKKYPNAVFQIFGEGSDEANLQKHIDELGLGEAVTLRGFTHNADKIFQQATMTLFSSNYETFGLTILESLSYGTPVASYAVRFGAKMMIEDSKNGILSKENTPESLASAMIKLYEANLSPEQVRRTVEAKFSLKRFENDWLALISTLTEAKNDAE